MITSLFLCVTKVNLLKMCLLCLNQNKMICISKIDFFFTVCIAVGHLCFKSFIFHFWVAAVSKKKHCTHARTHTHVHTHTHTPRVCTYAHMHMHTHTHTYKQTNKNVTRCCLPFQTWSCRTWQFLDAEGLNVVQWCQWWCAHQYLCACNEVSMFFKHSTTIPTKIPLYSKHAIQLCMTHLEPVCIEVL